VAEVARRAMSEIILFLNKASELINWDDVKRIREVLVDAKSKGKNILVVGMGRSGLVGRAFALRLMHLGFNVFVFGETITPAILEDDVVVAISGSGETNTVVRAAEVARKLGAKVIAITTRPGSSLAKLADMILVVPGKTKLATEQDYYIRQLLGEHAPLAPLGTLFEITALIVLDSLISELMERLHISEDQIRKRHATIE